MGVYDLDPEGFAVPPRETDPPLIVDADAVLALPMARQSFEPVAGRLAQIVEPLGCIERQQLGPGALLNLQGQSAHGMACEDRSGPLVAKAPDHAEA
jgi:hypothetical protein